MAQTPEPSPRQAEPESDPEEPGSAPRRAREPLISIDPGASPRRSLAVVPAAPPANEAPSDEQPLDDGENGHGALDEKNARPRPSDFGSMLADLSREEENPRLRVHDRTHLEISIDYDLTPVSQGGADRQSFVWEAYFFAPESLRLDSRTYGKDDVYEDLQSYVRLAVPDVPYGELVRGPLDRIERAIASGGSDEATREMRLFVSQVRAAGVAVRRAILEGLDGSPAEHAQAIVRAERLIEETQALVLRARRVLHLPDGTRDPLATAAAWIEEDFSRLLETMLADLAMALRKKDVPEGLANAIEQLAIDEAKHRARTGLGGVGRKEMNRRELEALEFRRHVLKRFTSSVLWLKPEVRPASEWVLHVLYAIAASVAMGFAIMAALWNGVDMGENYVRWAIVAIVAYAAKDRIKALLQTLFANVVSRHFPDRSWRVFDGEKKVELGAMEEQAGFVPFSRLPEDVLDVRRSTRRHDLEEKARPETVLFHRKEVELDRLKIAKLDERFDALTEILRLDLRRWLAHTDDPKREFVFADPERGVGSAVAPRVYNIGVVYRLRRLAGPGRDEKARWHRSRVVVTRKGIRRIDPVQ
jgi:hypothetical protein